MKKESKESTKYSQSSYIVSKVRLAAGFILSPMVGALSFYVLLNIPVLFGYKLPGFAELAIPSFFVGGVMIAGIIFYPPAVVIGSSIMLLIHRSRSWNFANCIAGGFISALTLVFCFMMLILLSGAGLAAVGGASSILLCLITIPSVIFGMSFWVITVYRHGDLEKVIDPYLNQNHQPALAGDSVDISISAPIQFKNSDEQNAVIG